MRSKHSISRKFFVVFAVLSSYVVCNPITNSDLNDHIKEFSSKNDSINSTGIKTLQKEESGRYANLSPVGNPVRFKDVPDSALSSSYGRGLVHHEHPGYTLHEYEESPVYGYEYHGQVPIHHGYDHHAPDHYHGHGGHHDLNYHHKYYDHALAAKAFLWPIAGLALLGAAAALVSNPVLLQLGVVSGRRKRRDTEETFDSQLDTELSWMKEDTDQVNDSNVKKVLKVNGNKQRDVVNFPDKSKSYDELKHRALVKKHSVEQEELLKDIRGHPTVQSPVEEALKKPIRFSGNKNINKNKLIPVPLLLKEKV